MNKDELRAWLRLGMTDGVGNDAARKLLACFGSPQAVFEQTEAALCQVVTPKQAQALLTVPNELAVQCVRTHQWLMHQPDTHTHALWTLGDVHYPPELLQLADPPLMLYVMGQTERTLGNAVAIVGSRNPTPQGAQTAEQFGEALSARACAWCRAWRWVWMARRTKGRCVAAQPKPTGTPWRWWAQG